MKYCVFDLETGGLSPANDAIVSIGVVVLDEGLNEIEHFYTIVKDHPEKNVSQEALLVNNLTKEEIEKGMPIADMMVKFAELTRDAIIVAHNAAFDTAFMNNRGFKFQQAIDTMLLSRKVFPGKSAKLSFVCQRFGIEVKDAHNALGDVMMTVQVLKKFSRSSWLNALEPTFIRFQNENPQ